MRDLVEVFASVGCTSISTYIQSGNVVFARPASGTAASAGRLEAAIAERFGFAVPVVLVPANELEAIVAENPFAASGVDEAKLHVGFLAGAPSAARIASLDPGRSSPDEFVVKGRAVYLHLPNGVARTKLTSDYFDRGLATTITVRNWRTTLALRELVQGRVDD